MPEPYINFKRERSFGDKINATFAFLSQNLKPIAKSALYIAGPFALITTLVLQAYQIRNFGDFSGTLSGGDASGAAGMFTSAAWLSYLGISYLVIFAMVALTIALAQRHIKAYIETGNAAIEAGNLAKTIWRDFLSALSATMGIGVLMFITMMVIIVPFSLLIAGLQAPFLAVLMVLVMFVGMLVAGSAMMLIYPILNFEKTNFFDAIGRVIALNSGKWWSTAGLVFITSTIQFVIIMALSIPVYAITFYQMLHGGSLEDVLAQSNQFSWYTLFSALASIVYSVGLTLIGSIMLIAVTLQYFNLRERREASGLLERMQSFGVTQSVHEEEEQY
ncbi:hypothetical protein D770_11850 [Flammeovirgaceae bacterium 311]|nr:hypothetical protein D770_11850 [Flammeovirgaceae bacterium 311]